MTENEKAVLLDGSLNRFNAEHHGDHAISIAWTREEVPAMSGSTIARVKRYWLDRDPANMDRARGLLGIAN